MKGCDLFEIYLCMLKIYNYLVLLKIYFTLGQKSTNFVWPHINEPIWILQKEVKSRIQNIIDVLGKMESALEQPVLEEKSRTRSPSPKEVRKVRKASSDSEESNLKRKSNRKKRSSSDESRRGRSKRKQKVRKIWNIPYMREKTDLLNRPTSQKWIIEIDTLSCPTHTFMLFLDALAQGKYT